jgi:tetratricopeptide (TPR) repeat protein
MDSESVDSWRRGRPKALPACGRSYGSPPFLVGYRTPPENTDLEVRSRRIATTLQMSLRAARAADPAGLAVPVLCLAALLDPVGHPHALWTQPPLLAYLSAHRVPPHEKSTAVGTAQVTADQVKETLQLLHRLALLVHGPSDEPRAVRVHAPTARAVRENISDTDLPHLATAAADALLHAWPETDHLHADMAVALCANTIALAGHTAGHLWRPEGHMVLYRAGKSLHAAGLTDAAVGYWQGMVKDSERLLGSDHSDTLAARGNLAAAYWQGGRTDEAIGLREQVVADRERLLGSDHLDTVTARANLATSYWHEERYSEAIKLEERVVADRERLLGTDHADTVTARANLATSYDESGRTDEAIELYERVVADRERLLGTDHPDTVTARAGLADLYWVDARLTDATVMLKQVVADRARLLGTDHPDTVASRADLDVLLATLE